MAHTALRLVLMAYLCCLCLSQGIEVILLGSLREAVGEIKDLSERFTEMDTRMMAEVGEVKAGLELLQNSQNGLQMQIQEVKAGMELLQNSQNGLQMQIQELQGGLELLTGSQNGVKEKVSELHGKMTLMEELNRTCKVEEQITELQNNFSTEFQRVEESVQKCSSGEQLSNFQVLLETDECADGIHRCSSYAACEDSLIQYTCTCLPGYTGDGFSCEDLDECSSETHRCHTNGECHNVMGNYTCTCDPGFSGDGFNCEVRCESPSRFFQTLGCVTPVTKYMSWEAAKRNCRDMGGRLLEKISSQSELDQLKEQFNELLTRYAWVGIYRWNWNETGDPIHPSSLWATGQPNRRYKDEYGCVGLHTSPPKLYDSSSISYNSLCQTAFPRE